MNYCPPTTNRPRAVHVPSVSPRALRHTIFVGHCITSLERGRGRGRRKGGRQKIGREEKEQEHAAEGDRESERSAERYAARQTYGCAAASGKDREQARAQKAMERARASSRRECFCERSRVVVVHVVGADLLERDEGTNEEAGGPDAVGESHPPLGDGVLPLRQLLVVGVLHEVAERGDQEEARANKVEQTDSVADGQAIGRPKHVEAVRHLRTGAGE
eukprot:1226617-Pleurochrysis_carterae.AAC.1